MPAVLALALTGALAWLATKIVRFVTQDARLKKCMPPSPPGFPLLGNVFEPKFQWLLFTKWRDELGTVAFFTYPFPETLLMSLLCRFNLLATYRRAENRGHERF